MILTNTQSSTNAYSVKHLEILNDLYKVPCKLKKKKEKYVFIVYGGYIRFWKF